MLYSATTRKDIIKSIYNKDRLNKENKKILIEKKKIALLYQSGIRRYLNVGRVGVFIVSLLR